jgi:hypothetical protein
MVGICSVEPLFPIKLWGELLHQATITCNLLQWSRINPHMSTHAHLEGYYDFNHIYMAPSVKRVIAHEKPKQCATWDAHGLDGWQIGLAPEQYWCYKVHINKTHAFRVVDTVEFFPSKVYHQGTNSHHSFKINGQYGCKVAHSRALAPSTLPLFWYHW